jgi:hypothetical protein
LLDVQATTSGDLERDFVTKLLIQTDVQGRESLVQTLRFRKTGPCPTEWEIGDAAAPGDRKVVNSLSGAERQLPSPVVQPAS